MHTGPLARNFARVLAGALISLGLNGEAEALANDPQLIAIAGFLIWAGTEGLYAFAKRKGWNT